MKNRQIQEEDKAEVNWTTTKSAMRASPQKNKGGLQNMLPEIAAWEKH